MSVSEGNTPCFNVKKQALLQEVETDLREKR